MQKNWVLIFGLALMLLLAGCSAPQYNSGNSGNQVSTGRVVFSITDAAADLESISNIYVTVDKVEVLNQGGSWVTVSSSPKTYDLLKLKTEATHAVLADVELEEGTYNQIRLDISEVMVIDSTGEHQARLPSSELKFVGDIEVRKGATSTASLDFIADESLHMTGNGVYVMAPVVQVETRSNAQASIVSPSSVTISGGSVKSKQKYGMDLEGNVAVGTQVSPTAIINIGADGKLTIGSTGRIVVGITDAKAGLENVSSINMTISEIAFQSSNGSWMDVEIEPQTFDLLELESRQRLALLVDKEIEINEYQQVRLVVSELEVTDEEGSREAKLPSSEIKINAPLKVEPNSVTSMVIDFKAGDSLHVTGNGQYIFAPVMQVESREKTEVAVEANSIAVIGGNVRTNTEFGMDERGVVAAGARISPTAILNIGTDGAIKVG